MRIRALACAALAALACNTEAPEADDVAVDVRFVTLDPVSHSPVIVLEERDGPRRLPIWIGLAEAQSIAQHLEAVDPPRPNTHDLAKSLVQGLDGAIDRVTVTELRDGTYYAVIALRSNGKPVAVDSRPSDAIALALRMGAPVFVRAPLFDESAPEPGRSEPPGQRTQAPGSPAGSRAATALVVVGNPAGKRAAATRPSARAA